ncbi:MAG: flagellar hook-basal body complex protein [Acutalibacteraceae bacterium]
MKISFYNGVSGLVAYQEDIDRISNNISNSGTVGYKASRTNFSQLLYTEMAVNSETNPLTGHGVKADDSVCSTEAGQPAPDGISLDFALMGDGFFAAEASGRQHPVHPQRCL